MKVIVVVLSLMTLALLYFLSYFFCLLCLHFVVDVLVTERFNPHDAQTGHR